MKEVHDHSFNVAAATALGHEKAILLKELYYWCQQNFNNQRNFHHGLYWTYNTAKAFTLKFPYFSERSIGRWLQQLEQDGYLGSACLNKKSYDRTKWYCVNEEAYISLCEGSKPGSLEFFKKYITNLANSNRQNGEWNSQNGESIGQNGEPIPPLNPSLNPSIKPSTIVEKEFSTVTLIDEVDETSVEIHHVPDWFEIEGNDEFISSKATQKPKEKVAQKRKGATDNPTPIKPMFDIYSDQYAQMNGGEKPEFMPKYRQPMKKLYDILEARQIQSNIIPLDNLQPWKDFIEMWGKYLQDHPKETYFTANFNPATFYSQFNTIVAKLKNQPMTTEDKWKKFYRENTTG